MTAWNTASSYLKTVTYAPGTPVSWSGAANLTDGDHLTTGGKGAGFSTWVGGFVVDLGESIEVSALTVVYGNAPGGVYPVTRIKAGDSIGALADVGATHLPGDKGGWDEPAGGMNYTTFTFAPTTARYWEVEFDNSDGGTYPNVTLREILINGASDPPDPPDPDPPRVIVEVDGVEMVGLIEKQCRVAFNEAGSFSFRIPKGHAQATAAILHPGAIVDFTFPEIDDTQPLFEGLLETGDFDLLMPGEEGAEELSFGGPGGLAVLRRAKVHFQWEYDTVGAPASVVKLSEGVWRWVNQEPGDILERLIEEAIARGVLGMVTYTFDDSDDSDGVPWTARGSWKEDIGASLYDAAMRLVAAGQMHVEMRPGMILDAFQTIGTDRTATSFGADKVRFVKAVNIVDQVGRSMAGQAAATHALVKGDDGSWMEVVKPGFDAMTDVYTEIVVEAGSHDPDVMEATGLRALEARAEAQHAIIFGTTVPWPGDPTDELSGLYLPGPTWSARGQYWPGDLVTLHTGTGDFEYDNETFRLYAITLRESKTGHLDTPIVELNSPWIDPDDDSPAGNDPIPASGSGTAGGSGSGSGSTPPHTHGSYQVATADAWKQPVRVATTANVNLASDLQAGDTIDGETLALADRVLVKDHATGASRGIYVVTSGAAVRATDFDASDEVVGSKVSVTSGTVNGGKTFRATNTTPPVIGTDTITFAVDGSGATYGTPALTLGTANAAGSTDEAIRRDATILAFDATVPVQDGAAGSAGAAATAARQDHKHPGDKVAIVFVIDGGGSAISTGVKGDLTIPFDCTLTAARTLADQSGSIVIDVWKDTYANYPPVVGDSITASAKPTLSGAIKASDTTLTGWTTTVSAGDTLRFNVDSATTVQRVTLTLTATRT